MAASIELPKEKFLTAKKVNHKKFVSNEPVVKGFRKYTIPQKHYLLKKLHRKDQGCVFMQGLPFGMTKIGLQRFMSQFGDVLRCRIHTCPKSGKTKGYGYVHFRYSSVAEVATKTMDKYLLLGNIIKCTLIPGRMIKNKYFKSKVTNFHKKVNASIIKNNRSRDEEKEAQLLKKRQRTARRHLAKLEGILQCDDLGLSVPQRDNADESAELSHSKQNPRRCLVLLKNIRSNEKTATKVTKINRKPASPAASKVKASDKKALSVAPKEMKINRKASDKKARSVAPKETKINRKPASPAAAKVKTSIKKVSPVKVKETKRKRNSKGNQSIKKNHE